jgi:hypothetical protein
MSIEGSDAPRRTKSEAPESLEQQKLRRIYWSLQPELLRAMRERLPAAASLDDFAQTVSALSRDTAYSAIPFGPANLKMDMRRFVTTADVPEGHAGEPWRKILQDHIDRELSILESRSESRPTIQELNFIRIDEVRTAITDRYYPRDRA